MFRPDLLSCHTNGTVSLILSPHESTSEGVLKLEKKIHGLLESKNKLTIDLSQAKEDRFPIKTLLAVFISLYLKAQNSSDQKEREKIYGIKWIVSEKLKQEISKGLEINGLLKTIGSENIKLETK